MSSYGWNRNDITGLELAQETHHGAGSEGSPMWRFVVANNQAGKPTWWLYAGNNEMVAWAGETFASTYSANRAASAFKAGARSARYDVYQDAGGS